MVTKRVVGGGDDEEEEEDDGARRASTRPTELPKRFDISEGGAEMVVASERSAAIDGEGGGPVVADSSLAARRGCIQCAEGCELGSTSLGRSRKISKKNSAPAQTSRSTTKPQRAGCATLEHDLHASEIDVGADFGAGACSSTRRRCTDVRSREPSSPSGVARK
jgi:hypothetical protein